MLPAEELHRSLPELAEVPWRKPMDERRLTARGRVSTAYTAIYVAPFIVIGVALLLIEPMLFPVAMWSFAHAWVIPELFAHRGARVAFPLKRSGSAASERTALGLLGDLLDHEPRELMTRTGLALEQGRLGAWLVGEAGASAGAPERLARALLLRARERPRAAARGSHRASPAGAARGRDRLRDRRQSCLHGRSVAGAQAPARGLSGRRSMRPSWPRSRRASQAAAPAAARAGQALGSPARSAATRALEAVTRLRPSRFDA